MTLQWESDDYDRLVELTPEDVDRARATFERHAPERFRTIFDDVEQEDV